MRNPLKKLQKKINVRLANKEAQHRPAQKSKDSPGKSKSRQPDTKSGYEKSRGLSVTSITEEDDPLFNNRSSRLRKASAEGKKSDPKQSPSHKSQQQQIEEQLGGSMPCIETTMSTSPKKKKKGGRRISFGGMRKVKEEQVSGPPPVSIANEKVEMSSASKVVTTPTRRSSLPAKLSSESPKKESWTPPRRSSTDERRSSVTPTKKSDTTPTSSAPASPTSPESASSNSHIPAPPKVKNITSASTTSHFDSPTKSSRLKLRDKAEVTAYVPTHNITTNDVTNCLPEPPIKLSQPPNNSNRSKVIKKPTKAELALLKRKKDTQRAALIDPALERIAKAAAALDHTGNQMFEKGDYDKAMAHYVRALKLKNRTLGSATEGEDEEESHKEEADNRNPRPVALEKTLSKQATTSMPLVPAHAMGKKLLPDRKEANPKAQTSDTAADDLWISVATSINNIGYLRQQSGQASAEETMEAYKNSLQIKRRVLGKDNLSVGKTLNNLGTVHYLKREYEQALRAYREALEIMISTLGSHHLDVGTVHSNIGDVYWAQSGDSKSAEGQDCQEKFYQTSRNSALRHYRHSLEIRWEELKDHHDPKIIRLLEKIAALEMGETFLALVQSSHKHRQSPTATGDGPRTPTRGKNADETYPGTPRVEQELQTLHKEVRNDVKAMDMLERKMAIDMVKDKLRLIREMKKLSSLNIYGSFDDDDEDSIFGEDSPSKVTPLSPVERAEALSAVKGRLQLLRDSRQKEDATALRRKDVAGGSDLKEADGSPNHYFLSHRASEVLNRALSQKPSTNVDDLDDLRKFSFNEVENVENDQTGDSKVGADKESVSSSIAVSSRTCNTLGEGIDALRSLSTNQDSSRIHTTAPTHPWTIATSVATSPEKMASSPTTPLPSATMSAF